MRTKVLNYRIIVTPDTQTVTGKPGYTALCPTLGVADDGDTVEEALRNVKGAIQAYVHSFIEDREPVPVIILNRILLPLLRLKPQLLFGLHSSKNDQAAGDKTAKD